MPSSHKMSGGLGRYLRGVPVLKTSFFTLLILFLPSICLSYTANYQWPTKEATFDISGANGTIAGESYKTLAITGMNNWLTYCIPIADFAFYNTDPPSDCSFNVHDSRNCTGWADLGSCSGTFTVGQTIMWLSGDNLTETDVALNSQCNNTGYWTSTRAIAVLSHEYGHAVGLGHSSDLSALMYPYLNASIWYPQADDCAGFHYIYHYKVAVPSDFNRDGKTDLLWQHQTTGGVYAWLMDGTTLMSGSWVLQSSDPSWKVVGTGDLNGDGKTDLIWRQQTTGGVYVWLMDGINFLSGAWIKESVGLDWVLVGTGDFNNDGKTDLLWQHKTIGAVYVWLMNGLTLSSSTYLVNSSDVNWRLVGTGDFNNDRKADLVWQNKTTGGIYVWLMDGTTLSSGAWVLYSSDLSWGLIGTGDFNLDGKTDLLWQHQTTGGVYVWLMDGTAISSGTWVLYNSDLAWKLVAP